MTATDSFRLGERKLFLESSPKEEAALSSKEYSFILPQKAAKEIINIFGEKQGQIKVYLSPNQVMFECLLVETPHPQIQLLSRLIEGDYPNYQEIIPKKFETQIILGKNEFLNQIKIASLFSGRISEVKFKVDPKNQKLQIFSQNPELGEYKSLLSGKIKGEPFEASFNHRFLIDGLLNIKSSEVIFELNKKTDGKIGPGVLKPVGDETYIYVVMPMGGN
jgi:DNA polymerase-3 subunit beta